MPARKEDTMVTYSYLFQFGILIVAIIGLVYKIAKKSSILEKTDIYPANIISFTPKRIPI